MNTDSHRDSRIGGTIDTATDLADEALDRDLPEGSKFLCCYPGSSGMSPIPGENGGGTPA